MGYEIHDFCIERHGACDNPRAMKTRKDTQPTVKIRLRSDKRTGESLTDEAINGFPTMTARQLRRLRRAVRFRRNVSEHGLEVAKSRQRRSKSRPVTSTEVIGASLGAVYPCLEGSTRYVPTMREVDDITVARDICDHERLSPLDGARPSWVEPGKSNDRALGNSAGRRVQPNSRI